jgi:hypothetical protein
MGKIKEREYSDYDDSLLEESEDLVESDLDIADGEAELLAEEIVQSRRTWRDTEKYKEMRELYKIINDELYIGFDVEEFLEDEE